MDTDRTERGGVAAPRPGGRRSRRAAGWAVPGILADRAAAEPALLRMLSRARRHRQPLLLVRLAWEGEATAARGRFLQGLGAEMRIGDLAWWEAGGLLLLLEADPAPGPGAAAMGAGAGEPAAVERWRRRAAAEGVGMAARVARFPEQGLTLWALLEAVS